MSQAVALVIVESPPALQALRALFGDPHGSCRFQYLDHFSTAVARLAGGGIGAIVLDLSGMARPAEEARERIRVLRRKSPHTPILLVSESGDAAIARAAGADGYASWEHCLESLASLVEAAVVADPRLPASIEENRRATVLAFLGVKGGVGTTSVALNVAASLAGKSRVILVELRPSLATLPLYFRHAAGNSSLADLVKTGASRLVVDQTLLWPCRTVPRLQILPGRQNPVEGDAFDPARIGELLKVLAARAEFVVLDLPAGLSPANRAAIQACQVVGLVLERDPVGISMAKAMLEEIESIEPLHAVTGAVVVNRAPVAAPVDLTTIERQLGVALLGVIAPAPEQFLAAQHARDPLVTMDPDSTAAGTLAALAQCLEGMALKHRGPRSSSALRTGEGAHTLR